MLLSLPLQLLCLTRLALCQVGIAGQFQHLLQTNANFDFDSFLKDSIVQPAAGLVVETKGMKDSCVSTVCAIF